jgi:hypothetical protein
MTLPHASHMPTASAFVGSGHVGSDDAAAASVVAVLAVVDAVATAAVLGVDDAFALAFALTFGLAFALAMFFAMILFDLNGMLLCSVSDILAQCTTAVSQDSFCT